MDIFDEVEMESSTVDDQPTEHMLPSKGQTASLHGLRKKPVKIRRHIDEFPLGADSGEHPRQNPSKIC
jgi:hypothetical protein